MKNLLHSQPKHRLCVLAFQTRWEMGEDEHTFPDAKPFTLQNNIWNNVVEIIQMFWSFASKFSSLFSVVVPRNRKTTYIHIIHIYAQIYISFSLEKKWWVVHPPNNYSV